MWCAVIFFVAGLGPSRVHELCASGHDALLFVSSSSLHVAHPPPSVRLFVSERPFVASRKSEKFQTGEILGGMHGLT